jgi:peptidoglycan L-alanyl-D-glutamate endopeptidase CwlK
MKIDAPSLARISKLHPMVVDEMKMIIDECNNALTGTSQVRVAQGLRTFAEQDALFKQRPRVTNASGGKSIHNYGFAVDIVMIINGKEASWDTHKDWDNDHIADWDECVKIFAKHGWNWGGNWNTFKDLPHFDKIGFSNWRVLINLPRDKNGYVIFPY